MITLTVTQLINLFTFVSISHFIADFVFQTRKMGEGKGTSLKWLTIHVATYCAIFSLVSSWYLIPILGIMHFIGYVIINTLCHFCTDFITSKMTSYFYKKAEAAKADVSLTPDEKLKATQKHMKGFWTTIGFDQVIHASTLFQTFKIYVVLPI